MEGVRIAVAGGTGHVGRHVVDVARERGHEPVVLARAVGVDLLDGARLADALEGVDVVVDVSGITSTSASSSRRFFGTVTANLMAAEAVTGVRHHLVLSIVNAARVGAGYYAGKARQEQAVQAGSTPWTILRTTQFHEFAEQTVARGSVGPVIAVPFMRTQPIAAREVAERLMDLALGEPQGLAPDLSGPREEQLVDMVRSFARKTHVRKPIIGVSLPGDMWKAMRAGALLPARDTARGSQTFAQWLDGVVVSPDRPHPE